MGLKQLKVDNFGTAGTRRVFQEMQIGNPPPSFRDRAIAAIRKGAEGDEKLGRAVETALAGAALVHRRVFSYAEFDVTVVGRNARLTEQLLRENGNRDAAPRSRSGGVVRPVTLPINLLVD